MIRIENFNKAYRASDYVIKDLNLSFPDTGLVVIYGKSGCGKTTILNAIGGMDTRYEGKIYVDDVCLPKTEQGIIEYRRTGSSFVFQGGELFDSLSVKENLKFVHELSGGNLNFEEVLERLNLKGFINRKVKHLSGGEKQRVAIARSLIKETPVVFLDEPTSALDKKNALNVFSILKEESKKRLIVMVSHDIKKASLYADRIIKLEDGKVLEDTQVQPKENIKVEKSVNETSNIYLRRIIKYFSLNGLFINLFAILLAALAISLFAVGFEGKNVKKNYDLSVQGKTPVFELNRTLLTQEKNGIDYFYVHKLKGTSEDYDGFRNYKNEKEGFSEEEIKRLKELIPEANLMIGNSQYGNFPNDSFDNYGRLIIKDIGREPQTQYENINTDNPDDPSSEKITFKEYFRSDYQYFLYSEKNNYNLIYGRLPEADDEILVSDVVAYVYSVNNSTSTDDDFDYSKIIYNEDQKNFLTVYDPYHRVKNYYYTKEVNYKVVGVIETEFRKHFDFYLKSTRSFSLLREHMYIRNGEYMNPAFIQPFGYIVVKNHLKGMYDYKFSEKPESFIDLKLNGEDYSNISIKTFMGSIDKRLIRPIEDDLEKDVYSRLLVKKDGKSLTKEEAIISLSLLNKLFKKSLKETDTSKLQEYLGKKFKLSVRGLYGSRETELIIRGISRTKDPLFLSSEYYNMLANLNIMPFQESAVVNLYGMSYSKRKELSKKLLAHGFYLRAIETIPSAYLEWVKGRGFQEVIDDEGFKEYLNISPYYLYSNFYTNKKIKSVNDTFDILNSMSFFIIVVALAILVGFLFLKEQMTQKTIRSMSVIGVRGSTIIKVNLVVYFIMGVLVSFLSFFFTWMFIDIMNGMNKVDMSLKTFINGEFYQYGSPIYIYRIRALITKDTFICSAVMGFLVFLVGFTSTLISVNKGVRK